MSSSRIRAALAALAILLATPLSGAAQDGFALKLGAAFNSSQVEDRQSGLRLSDAAGWNIGAEYLLPGGIALGLSGYTAGSPQAFDFSEGSLVFLADANYFFFLPMLPVTPYAGLNLGLGSHRLSELDSARPKVDFGDSGYQVGVRLQATRHLGVDVQYRRVSGTVGDDQSSAFDRDQFILSVALF